jgi:hypothetical protein
MASETLIKIALQLGKKLGANTSKFLGTKSNVTFLGSGPKDGMLFQKSIDPESFVAIGVERVLPDIETSLSYATGGKLNDIQMNKLIDNLTMMTETLNPTNVSKGNFGIDALRAKSGMVERQVTDVASDVGKGGDESPAFASFNTAENIDTSSPLMSKLENRVGGMRDEAEAATGILESVPRGDLPGKRAAAREFLVNALKRPSDKETSLDSIISQTDVDNILFGGGGRNGDPLVLVEKYFGPKIADMMPTSGTAEEMVKFTDNLLDNVVDAKGLRPDNPEFDRMTAVIRDQMPFADGGIARLGFKFGGSSKFLKKINSKMIKKAADDIFPTDDYKYDAELVVDALVENNPKIFKNMLAGDLDDALRSELYGLAVSETGNRAAMKIRSGRMERPLFDENGKLNKDAVLADASKYDGLDGRKLPTEKEGMKMAKNMSDEEFEVRGQFPSMSDDMIKSSLNNKRVRPRFQLNVDKAVNELNIPREEAIRIAQLPSDQQKLALQEYHGYGHGTKIRVNKILT